MDIQEVLMDLGVDEDNVRFYNRKKLRIELGGVIEGIKRHSIKFYHGKKDPVIGEKRVYTEVYKYLEITDDRASYLQKYLKLFSYFNYDEDYRDFINKLPVQVVKLCGSPDFENCQDRVKEALIKKRDGDLKTFKELSLFLKGRDFDLKDSVNLMIDISKNIRKYPDIEKEKLMEAITWLEGQLKEVRAGKRREEDDIFLPNHIGKNFDFDDEEKEEQIEKFQNEASVYGENYYDDGIDLDDYYGSSRIWSKNQVNYIEDDSLTEVLEGTIIEKHFGTEVKKSQGTVIDFKGKKKKKKK